MRGVTVLTELEYPRHLHKTHAEFLVVHNADEAAAALEEGWTVECPAPDAPVLSPVDVTEPDEPIISKKKRGRPPHASHGA